MPLSPDRIGQRATTLAAAIAEQSIHTADPGTTGANESSAPRQAVAATASGGVVTVPAASFTGGEASGPATYLAVWDSDGDLVATTQASAAGDSAFNAAGQADVASWTLTES